MKLRKNNDTMHCTEGGNSKLPFTPLRMHFKVWEQKKKKASQQSKSKDQRDIVPFRRAHYLDPRGKRRCSSTKALALHKHN